MFERLKKGGKISSHGRVKAYILVGNNELVEETDAEKEQKQES